MKISSIGVNAYREMTDQTRSIHRSPVPRQPEHAGKTEQVHIPGQQNSVGSKLSVRLPSADYAEMLSPEERQALELLFQQYGKGLKTNASRLNGDAGLGNFVDVKL